MGSPLDQDTIVRLLSSATKNPQERALLLQQIEQAQASQAQPQEHTTGAGAALGMFGGLAGEMRRKRAQELLAQHDEMEKADMQERQILMADILAGPDRRRLEDAAAISGIPALERAAKQRALWAEADKLMAKDRESRDPDSFASKTARELARKYGHKGVDDSNTEAQLAPWLDDYAKTYGIDVGSADKAKDRDWEREKFGLEQKVAEGKATEAERIRLQEMDEGLRKELAASPAFKGFLESQAAFNKLSALYAEEKARQKSGGKANPSNDAAFVYGLMKMIDAGAAVQEGDKANAEATTNLYGQLMNAYDRAKDGTGLQAKQREAFYQTGKLMFEAQKKIADEVRGQFSKLSESQGGTPSRVDLFGGGKPIGATPDLSRMSDEDLKALVGDGG